MVLTLAERDHLNRKIVTITHAAIMRRTLKLTCPLCQRERLLDTVPLWWLFFRHGWDDHLPKAATRFVCIACWRHSKSLVRPRYAITDTAPQGEQFPYPSDREWARFVRRRRG